MAETVHVWVDGSCLNNGAANPKAAIGIYFSNADYRNYSSRLLKSRQTNNAAELIAILCVIASNIYTPLLIHTDSNYSIQCVTSYYAKWDLNSWKTTKGTDVESSNIIKDIRTLIDLRRTKGIQTLFEYVAGHSGNVGNEAADKLARLAAQEVEEGGRIAVLRSCGLSV